MSWWVEAGSGGTQWTRRHPSISRTTELPFVNPGSTHCCTMGLHPTITTAASPHSQTQQAHYLTAVLAVLITPSLICRVAECTPAPPLGVIESAAHSGPGDLTGQMDRWEQLHAAAGGGGGGEGGDMNLTGHCIRDLEGVLFENASQGYTTCECNKNNNLLAWVYNA